MRYAADEAAEAGVIKMFWKMKEKGRLAERYRRGKFWWCVTMTVRATETGEQRAHQPVLSGYGESAGGD